MNNNNWLWISSFLLFLFISCESFFEVPRIEEFTFPSHVVAHKTISAICSAKEAKFVWLKDNKLLMNSSNVIIKSEENYSVIIIKDISDQSGGNYTCIATNNFGMSSQSTILTVITPPTWFTEQLDLVAVIGEKVSLECLTERLSKQVPKGKRTNQNGNIAGTVPFKLTNGSIWLNQMRMEMNNAYECIVDNTTSFSSRRVDPIKTKNPAIFDDKYTKVTIKKGDNVNLSCVASGDQPLSIVWKKDGKELKSNNGGRYEILETRTKKRLKSELFLREVDGSDGQLYRCVTENAYGQDDREINLIIIEVPSIPLDLKVHEILKRSFDVSWSPPYTGNSPITKYIIQYWKDTTSRERHRLEEIQVPSNQTSARIQNLHSGVKYGLAVIAENALGRGEPSAIVSFTTVEEEPSGAPVNVHVDVKGAKSLIITWKPPPKNEWNGKLKGYYIGYKINFDSNQLYSFEKVHYESEGTQEYVLTNLMKDSEYSIIVKAFNSAGNGPQSQEIIVRTLSGDLPSAPTISVTSANENSIKLDWRLTDHNSTITGYTVHYRKKEDSWQSVFITSSNENSYNLTGLQSDVSYQIYLSANNDYEEGYPSDIVTAKTIVGDDSIALLTGEKEEESRIDLSHVIPVTVTVLIAIVVTVAVCAWVVKLNSRKSLQRSIQDDKFFIFSEAATQVYKNTDKTKLPVEYHNASIFNFSTPYETMLTKIDTSDRLKDHPTKGLKMILSEKTENRLLHNGLTVRKQQQQQQKQWESKELSNM